VAPATARQTLPPAWRSGAKPRPTRSGEPATKPARLGLKANRAQAHSPKSTSFLISNLAIKNPEYPLILKFVRLAAARLTKQDDKGIL